MAGDVVRSKGAGVGIRHGAGFKSVVEIINER